jgi:hypothetical protein
VRDVFTADGFVVDEKTGQLTDVEYHSAEWDEFVQSSNSGRWAYDPVLDLFGWVVWQPCGTGFFEFHPHKEFAERFPEEVDVIKLVYKVDSTVILIEDGVEYFSSAGVLENFNVAIAFGNEIVTGFVYADFPTKTRTTHVIGVSSGFNSARGDWDFGIVNQNGDKIVGFDFDYVLTICDYTAFVKLDGKWGIINFYNFVPPKPPPPNYEEVALPAHLENLNWVVSPGFKYTWHSFDGEEYESFSYCNMCGFFFGAGDFAVDERTGLYVNSARHGAHGGGGLTFVYDPALDLMGTPGSAYGGTPKALYPRSEFALHFPEAADTLMLVRSVDSTAEIEDGGWDGELPWDAYFGRGAAVAVGNVFITDFVYNLLPDTPGHWWRGFYQGRRTSDKIEVADINGNYGVIGRDGSVVLPFEFETVMVIDNWTAFVQYGGRWGIVAFEDDEVPNFMPSGANNTYIDGDRVNLWWWVAKEGADYVLTGHTGHFYDLRFDRITNHGGRNIRAFFNEGSDTIFMRADEYGFLNINQIRLSREWSGEIVFYNDYLDYFQYDILTAVSTAEQIIESVQDYLRGLGLKIEPATGWSAIQITLSQRSIIPDAAFNLTVSAARTNGEWADWVYFEAVLVDGVWEVHDVTKDIWG